MTFADLSDGATIFLDANIFVYHFAQHPTFGAACTTLLDRIERQLQSQGLVDLARQIQIGLGRDAGRASHALAAAQPLAADYDAKLTREYIFSDAGQINLAKGNARPIRAEHLTLPADVQAKLLPNEQYKKVTPIKDADAWEKTSKALPQKWQEEVIINMQ